MKTLLTLAGYGLVCLLLGIAIGSVNTRPAPKTKTYQYQLVLTLTNGHMMYCPVTAQDMDYIRREGRIEVQGMSFRAVE